jgi:uncharacterized protein with GYD domain
MPYYLVQSAYTPASMTAMVQSPQDRSRIVRSVVEKLGGHIESFWLAFGEYDVVLILQMPNDQSMAAFSIAVSAGGAVRSIHTTPLMKWEEGMLAMKQAASVGYTPPGS